MRKIVLAVAGVALGLGIATAQAQEGQAAGGSHGPSQANVPTRGLTTVQVEQRYGSPTNRIAAIGQPPIARWVYPSFVVYFEYDLVIHAVATQVTASNN
jgi:cytochrome oxidase Cu insertion factor (SCO1/SenC/PrrC family)